MEKKVSESSLIIIFFKNLENELLGLLPLINDIEVIELKPIIKKKLAFPKEANLEFYDKNSQQLDDFKTLKEQNITAYNEILLIIKSKDQKELENNEIPEKNQNFDKSSEEVKESSHNISSFKNLKKLLHLDFRPEI